jgi:hypothetical protein
MNKTNLFKQYEKTFRLSAAFHNSNSSDVDLRVIPGVSFLASFQGERPENKDLRSRDVEKAVVWLPRDLGTWGFILSLAALLLTIPLGIVSTLLAPKVRLWWFLRNVKGTANKLISLTEYRDQLEKEPQFTVAETYIFEAQLRMIAAWLFIAYLILLAIALIPKWHRHMTFKENLGASFPALPFVVLIIVSAAYLGGRSLDRLRRSSPMEREKVERQIGALVEKSRSKIPPQTHQ